MNTIKIKDKKFELFISEEEIQSINKKLAERITKEYFDKHPIFIGVLNGAFLFSSDLIRLLDFDSEITFVKMASYIGIESTGNVKSLIGLNENIKGKHIIILEDIVESGLTMLELIKQLKEYEPASIKIVSLFFKPNSFKEELKIDFIGKEIPNKFIVGYGLDYNGLGRNYNNIYKLIEE